jgi:outer membrane lipoprotein-sorting protein
MKPSKRPRALSPIRRLSFGFRPYEFMKNLLLALCALALAVDLRAESVEAILTRMDQASPNFHGVTANVQMITYTAILSDQTTETGTLKMQRQKGNDVRAIIELSAGTDTRVIAFLGKIVRIYFLKLKTYQDYDVGKNTQVLNQYLLLGFGSSGKDLARSYKITAEGSEDVGGQITTKLLLMPKDAKVKERLTKIEVWIPKDAAYPLQQQFYEPSGNYRKVAYSNVQLNPPMAGTLELKLPPGVTKQTD